MSTELSPDVRASYALIIDSILVASDLTTITSKRIREGLQRAVNHDLAPQKDAVRALIGERFDKIAAEKNVHSATSKDQVDQTEPETGSTAEEYARSAENPQIVGVDVNGTKSITQGSISERKRSRSPEQDIHMSSGIATPHKKVKAQANGSSKHVDSDAALAKRLQALEDSRSRATRGAAQPRKSASTKKSATKSKSKSAARVTASDDSDVSDSDRAEKKVKKKREVNRNNAFHKEMALSQPLSDLLDGEAKLSRPQATKKIWDYIKSHSLQEEGDRRWIRCDDAMRAVFKVERVQMFAMTKLLNQNLYPIDE